jgi:hypothetical protein
MTETPEEIRARHHDESGAMHYAVRDGSVWLCVQCRSVLGEFGQGRPVTEADCVPRTWGDGAPA